MKRPTKWKLKIEHLMACNCNWGCPCSFESLPTYGKCGTALAYRVVEGTYGGVSLDGLKWMLVACWPGPIHEGNGRGMVLIDERTKGAKRESLEAIATGKAGGPMKIYISTLTAGPDLRTARIDFKFAGKGSSFRAGEEARVEFEPMRNPVTGQEHHLSGILPTGLMTKREDFYSAKTFHVHAARSTSTIRAATRLQASPPGAGPDPGSDQPKTEVTTVRRRGWRHR